MKAATNDTFFVSPGGNDSWSGRLPSPNAKRNDGPFATLPRSRDAIREWKTKGKRHTPVTVMVRGGKYFFGETFVLSFLDSGTPDCPIHYEAYPGEKPILSGGRKLTEWRPYKGKILQCAVPEAKGGKWKFRQLFFNGKRQVRARYPNIAPKNPLYGGWAFMAGPAEEGSQIAFKYKAGAFPRRWAKPSQGEVNVFPFRGWHNNIIPIQSVDGRKRIIRLQHGTTNFNIPPWYCRTPFQEHNRFIVENLLEELDQPGEWCFESDEGILYFWPPTKLTKDVEVVAPWLDRLIDIHGACHIRIAGFTFTETGAGDNLNPFGLDGYGAMFPTQGWKYCGEAVHLEDTHHITIESNHFDQVGGNAIYLESQNTRNVIQNNEIGYAGTSGICLLGTAAMHPMFNQVLNNHIHHGGVFNKYAAGVSLGVSSGNVVGHNSIHHLPHHGINLGVNGFGRNIIEYNEIRHTCLETYDNGAINSWMDMADSTGIQMQRNAERSGHIIRYNLVADAWSPMDHQGALRPNRAKTHTFAIYLDNGTSNCWVYGNIVLRCAWGVFIHCGKNNIIENNIFVDCFVGARFANWIAQHLGKGDGSMADFCSSNRFSRNIVVLRGAGAKPLHFDNWNDQVIEQSDFNLFYHASARPLKVERRGENAGTLSWTEWRKMGYDAHSRMADPLFANSAGDDYRLALRSPAFQLGFQPIAMKEIGVRHASHGLEK